MSKNLGSQLRRHFATGKSLDVPGGLHRTVNGVAQAQKDFQADVQLIDFINKNKFRSNYLANTERPQFYEKVVNHYHFSPTYFESTIFHPIQFKADLKIFHFHGPWAQESAFESPDKRIRNYLKMKIEKLAYKRFPIIVSASKSFNEILVSQYGYPLEKTLVLPLGVDTKKFLPIKSCCSPYRLNIHQGLHLLGTVRRLVPRMGIEYLIQAMVNLPDCALLIAGEGPMHYDLQQLISNLGLNNRIKLLGFIADQNLVHFYNSLDLLVMPSVALEGFGLTSLEAFSCGKPVIGSNIEGIRESVGKVSAELLFEPSSPESIVKRVRYIFNESKFNSNHFRDYAELHSWENYAYTLETAIETRF